LVSTSDDIIKRAKELEMLRKLKESGQLPQADGHDMNKMLQILKEVHQKILNVLQDWMNTQNLAQVLGYRQEYVSRKVAELKEMGKVDEKREGKNLFYRKVG
jgi:DNA-binding transcriptional ArsR family regulator